MESNHYPQAYEACAFPLSYITISKKNPGAFASLPGLVFTKLRGFKPLADTQGIN